MQKIDVDYVEVPLLTSAFECGKGTPFNDFWDYAQIPHLFVEGCEEPYIIKATGDSMHPKIEEGDMLVVDYKKEPQSGDMAAIWYNGGYIVKELWQNNFSLFLVSLNKKYPQIKVNHKSDEIVILGKICGIYKPV